jgi:hypothetical protein
MRGSTSRLRAKRRRFGSIGCRTKRPGLSTGALFSVDSMQARDAALKGSTMAELPRALQRSVCTHLKTERTLKLPWRRQDRVIRPELLKSHWSRGR